MPTTFDNRPISDFRNRQSGDKPELLEANVLKLQRVLWSECAFCGLMRHLEKLGNIDWKDAAAIETAITQKIPKWVASDEAYQNAREHSDPENILRMKWLSRNRAT